jgi:replicative DNA helicase
MRKKELPCSRETEEAILASLLTSQDQLNSCIDILELDDFFFEENKIIFEAIKKTCQSGTPVDVHIIANRLKADNLLEVIGGVPTLITMCQNHQSTAYAEEYCSILRGKRVYRDIISTSTKAIESAQSSPVDCGVLLDDIQRQFCSIAFVTDKSLGTRVGDIVQGKYKDSAKPIADILDERREQYKTNPSKPPITGLSTGFPELDTAINGLNESNLVMLAACTSVGKTAFALNVVDHVACELGLPVGVFSLEMTAEQLTYRLLCSRSGVPSEALVTGNLSDEQLARIREELPKIEAAPIIIDDRSHPKIQELRRKARRLKACFGIRLLVVDYLTLVEPASSRASDNRQTDVASISRALKLLARELEIPILCLAQLSRKVDDRPGHRPVLGDLRESGAIEHDSDVVLFLFRRDYYDSQDRPGEAEIIIAKNRCGRVGSIILKYERNTTRFSNGRK